MSAVFVPTRRKFSADQFERLGRSGILREDERVELLEGEMIDMAPIGSRHASAVNTLSMLFARAVGESALVSTQNRLRLSDLPCTRSMACARSGSSTWMRIGSRSTGRRARAAIGERGRSPRRRSHAGSASRSTAAVEERPGITATVTTRAHRDLGRQARRRPISGRRRPHDQSATPQRMQAGELPRVFERRSA